MRSACNLAIWAFLEVSPAWWWTLSSRGRFTPRRCWASHYTPEEEEVILAATIAFCCTIKDVRWAFQEERKGSPTAESIDTDHRIWPEESKPGVSTMEALLLSSQSRSSSSAATASFNRLQKVLNRPTSSTACEGYGWPYSASQRRRRAIVASPWSIGTARR